MLWSTSFVSARFNDTAFFGDSQFNQTIDLSSVQFQRADFSGVKFNRIAYFYYALFNQEADFKFADFNLDVIFDGTEFNETAYFMGVEFNQSAIFSNVEFKRSVYFTRVRFNETTDFSDTSFNQVADFSSNDPVIFEGGLFIPYAFFDPSRTWFNGTAKFDASQFKQSAFFMDARFIDLSLDSGQFSNDIVFGGAQINGILSLNRTKYDTFEIRWSSIHDLAYDDTAYHLLIQNFNKLGFSDDASECQYSYRCKHREELFSQHKFDRWLFDLLAYATYGYGLRPVRPLGWAALFILVGGLFFFLTGSVTRSKAGPSEKRALALRRREKKPDGNVTTWEAFLLSATYFTSGASSIISATPTEFVPVGPGRYVVVLLRLLGWIFFVLFLSSLNRTV